MPLRPGKLDLLFRISHLLDLRAGGQLFIICYYQTLYTLRQIHHATAIKSGRVIAGKAIMTVEAAGLEGSGR